MQPHEYIEYVKEKYPNAERITGGNERDMYYFGINRDARKGVSTNHVNPYKTIERQDKQLGHSFMANAGSYFVDLTNWGDTFKDAYNNSAIGLYESAMSGELPYELTIDPRTGKPVDLNMLQKGASFVMSMFAPADLASFFVGGKVLGMVGAKFLGSGLRKQITKNLAKGYSASGFTTKEAEKMAAKRASQMMSNPSTFMKRKPVYETFTDPKLHQRVTREIYNGKNIADAWKLNANVLGGQLASHRGLHESVHIMNEKGQQDPNTGEWIPGKLEASDWKKIAPAMARSYATGLAIGGVKALAGSKLAHGFKGDNTLKGHVVNIAEFGAESLVFGITDPLLQGRAPTYEEIKHSAFGLLSIKTAGAASSRLSKTLGNMNHERKLRNQELKERIRIRDDQMGETTNPQMKDIYKNDNIKDMKELKFNVDNEFDYSAFQSFNKRLENLKEKLGEEIIDPKTGKPVSDYEIVNKTFKDLGETDINIIKGELEAARKFSEQFIKDANDKGMKLSADHQKFLTDLTQVENYLDAHKRVIKDKPTTPDIIRMESDIDIIESFLKPTSEGGASGSRNQLDGHTKQVYDKNNVPLYFDEFGQRTTDRSKAVSPVLEIKDASSRKYLKDYITKEQKARKKAQGIQDIEDLTEDPAWKIDKPENESGLINYIYNVVGDFGGKIDSAIGAKNKAIIGSLVKKHVNSFDDTPKRNAKDEIIGQSETRAKIASLNTFANWLAKEKGLDLSGGNTSPGTLRTYFNEFLLTGNKGKPYARSYMEKFRKHLSTIYGHGHLETYLGYNPIPGKTIGDTKAKFVAFMNNQKAAEAIEKELGKDPYGFSGKINEDFNINNLEWSVFHRLAHRSKGRQGDLRDYIIINNYNPNTRAFNYTPHKTSKHGKEPVVFTLEDNKFDNQLHLDLVDIIGGRKKSDMLFPNINKYSTAKGGQIKQGFLRSIRDVGKDAQIWVDFGKKVGPIEPGDLLRILQPGTEGSHIASVWRTHNKNKITWNEAEYRDLTKHSGYGVLDYYAKREGMEIRKLEQEIKLGKITGIEPEVQSRFLKEIIKGDILTKENSKEVLDYIRKNNPGVKIIFEELGEGVAAKTTFKAAKDVISVQLGKTDLTSLFHENMEILLKHAERSGDKGLARILKKGIESTSKEAKQEWKIRGGAKGTGYKDFNTFKKEWFMDRTGRYARNKWVESSVTKKIATWMKEMFTELKRYFFGIESNKLSAEDYIMLVGRRGYKGVNTLHNRGYRNKAGEVVYKKLSSNRPKDIIQAKRRTMLRKLEEKAEKTGVPTRELFKNLRWKERFGVKSFGEIKNKTIAAMLLKDMEMSLDWNKINDRFREKSIDYTRRYHEGNWKEKGIFGFFKSGEFQKWILNPYVVIEKFAPGNKGRGFIENILEPFDREHQRYQGTLIELRDRLYELGAKDKDFDYISTYDKEVYGTQLSSGAKKFKVMSEKEGTNEYMMVKAVKDYYSNWYDVILPNIIKERFTPRVADKLLKKLKNRREKNYFTHSMNPKLKDFYLNEKEGQTALRKLAEQNLFQEIKDTDKQYLKLLGKKSAAEKKVRESTTEAHRNANLQAVESIKEQMRKRFEEATTSEALDKAYNKAIKQIEYSPDYVMDPNIDVKRFGFGEFYNIEDPFLQKKYGGKKLRTWDTTFDGTVIAYGQRMSSFAALLKNAPEFLKFTQGDKLYGEHPVQRQIDAMANSIKGSSLDKESFKSYIKDVLDVSMGLRKTSPRTSLGKAMMNLSRYSAAMGLSSPFSGAKNVLLGHSAIVSFLGVKAAKEAWAFTLSPEVEQLARMVGAKQVGSRTLAEVGLVTLPGGKKTKVAEMIGYIGGMTPTEYSNRKRAIAASLFYANDGFKQLSGKETIWFKNRRNAVFLDKMKNEFRLTDEMIALGEKYGVEAKNIPTNHPNYKNLIKVQEEMRLRVAQYGHQITQGATGVANLPLWMNSTMLGKWGTVFHRIAYSMTTNINRNVVKPLVKHQNPLPLFRYAASHVLSGYVLWQLKDFILGQEEPHKAFDSDKDAKEELGKMIEYAHAGELGGAFSLFLNPLRKKHHESSVLGNLINDVGVVNIRNLENLASNVLAYYNGQKYIGQSLDDMAKSSLVIYNHAMRGWYKQTSPYLAENQNVRKSINTHVSDYGLEDSYGGGGASPNEASPIYRRLRHAFMLGKPDGPNGYVNVYWNAWYHFLSDTIEDNPGISYKEAKKTATKKLESHVRSYDPIVFSANSKKGKIHRKIYMDRLSDSHRIRVKNHIKEYEYKSRKFWKDVNAQAHRFRH